MPHSYASQFRAGRACRRLYVDGDNGAREQVGYIGGLAVRRNGDAVRVFAYPDRRPGHVSGGANRGNGARDVVGHIGGLAVRRNGDGERAGAYRDHPAGRIGDGADGGNVTGV
jgi:hypothetical protein